MPITFQCPQCGQELTAPDQAAGQSGKCRFCSAVIQAPLSSGEPAQLLQPGTPAPPPPPPPGAGAPGTDLPPGYGAVPPPPGGPEGYAGGPGYEAPPAAPGGYGAPGAYSGYATPYAAGTYGPSGRVDPAAILGEAWQFIWGNWGLLAGVTLIIMIVGGLTNVVTAILQAIGVGEIPAMIATVVVSMALVPLQMGGPLYIGRDIVQGRQGDIGSLFKPYERFGAWIGLYLLMMVLMIPAILLIGGGAFMMGSEMSVAVGVVLVILGIIAMVAVFTGVALAPVGMVDRGESPLEAIQGSWSAVTPSFGTVFVTAILLGLAYMAGILACCIGLLLTFHFLSIGPLLMYRELRGFANTGN